MTALIRDPNNLRNRYRRKRAAYKAYQWSTYGLTLRGFANWPKHSYSAGPRDLTETFTELLERAR